MNRNPAGAQMRPGWTLAPDDSVEAQLPRRRWRILHNAKPRIEPPSPTPNWIKTPEDFVRWLASRLSLNELYTYFRDLEAIAKMSCDLELLRFARRYLESDLAREFAEKRERI
jgi:hypothetical protein